MIQQALHAVDSPLISCGEWRVGGFFFLKKVSYPQIFPSFCLGLETFKKQNKASSREFPVIEL